MRARDTIEGDERWRGDPTWIWAAIFEFAMLVVTSAILITAFAGAGFWPWLIMAGAIALGWLTAVVVLIPRSTPRRRS